MRHKPERTRASWGILATMVLGCTQALSATQVHIDGGLVEGTEQEGVIAYKGIPFAAAPTGALRWRAPAPAPAWKGILHADHYGPDCMQVPFPGDAAPLGETPAEDCLYLNLWKPGKPARKLPVMVWIYGGGFVNGGSSPAVYDGSAFARDGILLVSFNYRVGNFGFFAHPALRAENPAGPLGNYGLMDQVAALKWVQKNISRFGGDPGNVTLFGESAGGMSVHALLLSPLAQGLFHRAIIESGGGRGGGRSARGLPEGEQKGLELARKFEITGEGPDALARLRALPANVLVSGLNMATMGRETTYAGGPLIEPQLNPGSPAALYAAGKGARVPVIVGANSADIGFMAARTADEFYAQFGTEAEQARAAYPVDDSHPLRAALSAAGGDQMMVEPARKVAQLLAARGTPVYEFRFSYVAQSLRQSTPGAPHATEIPYVFDTVEARYGRELTEADRTIARATHAYWVAFARTGRPEPPGLPAWPAYDSAKDLLMNFTEHGPIVGPDPWKARLDLAQHVNESREKSPDASH